MKNKLKVPNTLWGIIHIKTGELQVHTISYYRRVTISKMVDIKTVGTVGEINKIWKSWSENWKAVKLDTSKIKIK